MELIKQVSDVLFELSYKPSVTNIKQYNINNDFVNKYASSIRADARTHLDKIVVEFKKIVCIFKNVNQLNVADRIIRYILKSLVVFSASDNTKMLLLVENMSVLDLLYAGFYVYAVFFTQLMYRKKTYKLVSGKNTNEKTTAEFPGCHPGVVRILLNEDNMRHAMRGIQFFATIMNDIGDVRLFHDTYKWWYNDFVRRRFIEISNKGIPMSFVNVLFKFKVAPRFMPYVSDETLFIPNLFNPVVYSSRDNLESSFLFFHFIPKTNDKLFVIQLSEQLRDFMSDMFGWYNNRSKDTKSIVGRIDLQMVITYLQLSSSMYLMVQTKAMKKELPRRTLAAMCHFFHHFQTGGEQQWKAFQPIACLVTDLVRSNTPRKMDLWTVQEQIFFGKNVNNNTRNRFYRSIVNDGIDETTLDKLAGHFSNTDQTFRPMLIVYVHLINWIVVFLTGNTTLESGLLEFSKHAKTNDFFKQYINIHDPDDKRVRVISHWMVMNRIQVQEDARKEYQRKVIAVVFDEVINALKRRKGLLSFIFRR